MVIITKKIILDPIFLSKDYKLKIIEKINELCYNQCTKEDGYILKVNWQINGRKCDIIGSLDDGRIRIKYLDNTIIYTVKPECLLNKTRILDNYISGVNSSIIFIVEIDVDNLKPELGDIFSDKVCMIFSGGLFVDVKNKMKVLIPSNSLSKIGETFVDNKNNIIKNNDIIKVKIIGVKYSTTKKNFSCFGELN